MRNNVAISVIMSAYNAEKFISQSIESILNQSFQNFELIIVDDASSDNTLNIIRKYGNRDSRIKIIRNKKNIYATKSRNKAIKIAKGKYIAIQDADDVSLVNRLKIQYEFLENNKSIFLIGTGILKINEHNQILEHRIPFLSYYLLKLILPIKNCIYHPTIMFRNDKILYRNKIYYSEDYDLYLSLLSKKKRLQNLPFALVKYRVLKNSVSRKRKKEQIFFANIARRYYFQRLFFKRDNYSSLKWSSGSIN